MLQLRILNIDRYAQNFLIMLASFFEQSNFSYKCFFKGVLKSSHNKFLKDLSKYKGPSKCSLKGHVKEKVIMFRQDNVVLGTRNVSMQKIGGV